MITSLDSLRPIVGLTVALAFVLSTLIVPSLARAADYHINAKLGDDTRDGLTPGSAWRTLDRINAQPLKPGDSVLLAADSVFQGQLKPKGEGSEQRPITIGMYGRGAMPRIDGNGRVDAPVLLYNTQHITVQDLHLTNQGDSPGERRRGLIVQIENFGVARNITLRRLSITDVNGALVKEVSGGAILFRNSGDQVKSRFDGLVIEHNYIARTQRNGINGSSGYVSRAKWFPSTNVVIRNNLLEQIPGDGIVPIGCDGALVESNVIRDGLPLDSKPYSAAAGIWPWSCDNTLIQYNEVSHQRQTFDAQGFDSDWNCRGTIIQYNYSHNNEGGFLLVCNDGKSKPDYSIGNTGTIVRYNVSFNDGLRVQAPGSKVQKISPSIHIGGPVDGVEIHDNVIIVPRKPSPDIDTHLVRVRNWNGLGRNIRITNNLFITEAPAGFEILKGVTNCVIKDNRAFGPVTNDADQVTPIAASPLANPFQHPGPGLDNALRILKACGIK